MKPCDGARIYIFDLVWRIFLQQGYILIIWLNLAGIDTLQEARRGNCSRGTYTLQDARRGNRSRGIYTLQEARGGNH